MLAIFAQLQLMLIPSCRLTTNCCIIYQCNVNIKAKELSQFAHRERCAMSLKDVVSQVNWKEIHVDRCTNFRAAPK